MSWRKVLALGGVASAIAVGCTVNVHEGNPDGGFFDDTGGSTGKDAGTGGTKATGGSGGKATGGASTGGKGGASTGGKAGAGTGGAKMDASPDATVCTPDPTLACDNCIETKCCQEWLDCVNDTDCFQKVGGQEPEYSCIFNCIVNDGGAFPTIEECAGMCKHDAVGISAATNGLVSCLVDTGDSGNTMNCTTECFNRPL
jgi:hypothetical protein